MINKKKWIETLPGAKIEKDSFSNNYNYDKIVNTVPQKNTYSSVKKYSLMTVVFIFGLFFVSLIKNETRNLQKEINSLETSINSIRFNLGQATLDNSVITSPENITMLASEYLGDDLVFYKKSQISSLDKIDSKIFEKDKELKKKVLKKENKSLQESIKNQILQGAEKKKVVTARVKRMYSDPKSIPYDLKNAASQEVKEKRIELRKILTKPDEIFTLERVGRWGAVQVVKVFLGVPITPGR